MNAILRWLPIVKRACNFLIFQCSWNSRWSLLNEVHYLFSLKCFDKLECSIGLLYVQFLYLHKKCEVNKFSNLRFAHLLSFFVQVHVFSLLPTLVLKKKRSFYLIQRHLFRVRIFKYPKFKTKQTFFELELVQMNDGCGAETFQTANLRRRSDSGSKS